VIVAVLALCTSFLFAVPAPAAVELSIAESARGGLEDFVRQHATSYGGVAFTAPGTATVYVPSGTPAALGMLTTWAGAHLAAATTGTSGYRLRFAPAKRPLAELLSARSFLQGASPVARAAMRYHNEDHLDVATGKLVVTVTRRDAPVLALEQALGDRLAVRVKAVRAITHSRLTDADPMSGGLRLNTSQDQPLCTGAFAVNGTAPQLLTAGHCAPLGAELRNGALAVGTVTARERTWGGYDAELLAGRPAYAGRIWVDGVDSTTTVNVHSVADPVNGETLCVSGSFTGERCLGVVEATDVCVTFSRPDGTTEMYTCHLARAHSTAPTTRGGDSGAPVYRYRTSTTVYAVGIHNGAANYPDGAEDEYFTPVSGILAQFGVALATS
jgi:hypothetical protein